MNASSQTSASLTRRKALLASATVGATAVLPVAAASGASAATQKATRRSLQRRPRSTSGPAPGSTGTTTGAAGADKQRPAALPDARTRQILTRFTAGISAERLAAVAADGGIEAWFEHQLAPGDIPDSKASATWGWWPTLALSPADRFARYRQGIESGAQMMQCLSSWTMMRRLMTTHQVEESMVDFWTNHLHVCSPAAKSWVWRIEYQKLVQARALGRFDDLLVDAIQHPAMGLYLNNTDSTAGGINENLGRELLELHTLGVGNFTEDDVVNSARILTGFHVDTGASYAASYVPADHWVGKVKVQGFTSANKNPNGIPVLVAYLRYLARHPATAKRICTKLAVRFMADAPSKALVTALVKVYQASDTAIVPVLRALVASNEFKVASTRKVRTPVEDALATWTAVGAVVAKPLVPADAANQLTGISGQIGQVVFMWPTPDAFPDLAPAWANAGRLLGSMRCHWDASTGTSPKTGITFRSPTDWMPQLPAMFSDVVNYVAQNALFVPSTPEMLASACIATGIDQNELIDQTHVLIKSKFPRLMVSILDTVEHLSR